MVRELSGVQRAEIIKQLWSPVVAYGNACNTVVNSHAVANIDHATDAAYMTLRVPNTEVIRDIQGWYLVLLGKAGITDMHIDVDVNYGENLDDLAAASSYTFHQTTVANKYHYLDLTGGGTTPWLPVRGHVYGVKAYHNANVQATNVYVLGNLLLWY